jgi:hypothetical protein
MWAACGYIEFPLSVKPTLHCSVPSPLWSSAAWAE